VLSSCGSPVQPAAVGEARIFPTLHEAIAAARAGTLERGAEQEK